VTPDAAPVASSPDFDGGDTASAGAISQKSGAEDILGLMA
jgi:hypothetical protein